MRLSSVTRREFHRRAGVVGLDSSTEANRAYWSEPLERDSLSVRTLLTGGFPALVQNHSKIHSYRQTRLRLLIE
jgi:hypothetical protein